MFCFHGGPLAERQLLRARRVKNHTSGARHPAVTSANNTVRANEPGRNMTGRSEAVQHRGVPVGTGG